jgi:hypothetical protein
MERAKIAGHQNPQTLWFFVSFVVKFLEQPFLALQIPERPDIRQGESKAVLIFISDRPKRKATVFEAQAAAIPVISSLRCPVLQQIELAIEADIRCRAPSSLGWAAISKLRTNLIEERRHARRLVKDVRDASG